MSIPAGPRPLTYDDYAELPDDGNRYELIDGEIFVTPAPVPRHQIVSRNLEWTLYAYVRERALGEVLYAPIDVVLDPAAKTQIVQPDLVYISKENLRIIGEKYIEGPPDLIVEIFSPRTRRRDVRVKSELYARYGVASYWLVDPDIDRIEVLELAAGRYEEKARADCPAVLRPARFPGLEISLADVFARGGNRNL
ncbi:MAG: Uma2 family endonuclease [Candidatus Schekmanbacteria bacterium]|nr:Uma2 family endonuclease [Candidatus Schekmanbacteria bacterium]